LPQNQHFMDNPVIIFGATGIGKAAYEIFESNSVVVYGFLDDDPRLHGTEIDKVTVLGATDDDGFLKLIGKKCEAFVAIDDNRIRKKTVAMLNERRKVMPANAVHRTATVSLTAVFGHGNMINQGVLLGSMVTLGHHCLVHSGAVIDFGARLGDFVQVGAGAIIGAEVVIEDEAFIGAGVTIVSGVTIGKGARVGAGSVVIASVEAGKTVFGNPAKAM
jgi:sugar O-acyltransferase (sialic acid O-acetyltransferase NeuD family)